MAVFQEEFIRCECGCPDYEEKKIVTFHKKIRPRDSKIVQLEPIETEYKYFCTKCGAELSR